MFTLSDLSARREGQIDSKVCLRRDYLLGTEASFLEQGKLRALEIQMDR